MIKWDETINIATSQGLYSGGHISLCDLSRAITQKIRQTIAYAASDSDLLDIVCAFEAIDELATLQDYNTALEMLYDYGDEDNRIWIESEKRESKHSDYVVGGKSRNPFDQEDTKPLLHIANKSISQPVTEPIKPIKDWDKDIDYMVDSLVMHYNAKYQCLVRCKGLQPSSHSFGKDPVWKYVCNEARPAFDPSLVLSDRLSFATPSTARVYPSTRKFHYMSESDFNSKLKAVNVNPANLSRELYTYIKESDANYQEWLITKYNNGNMTFKSL